MITPGRRKRHTELRAKRWGVKPAPKAPSWRDEYFPERMAPKKTPKEKLTPYEAALKKFVEKLPCINCGKRGPSTASHVTLSADEKGTGMKVDHKQVVPHCETPKPDEDLCGGIGCHPQWEQRKGQFRGWSRERRYAKGAEWMKKIQEAITPFDRDSAADLQAAGLGTVVPDGDGWAWVPGSVDDSNERKDAA